MILGSSYMTHTKMNICIDSIDIPQPTLVIKLLQKIKGRVFAGFITINPIILSKEELRNQKKFSSIFHICLQALNLLFIPTFPTSFFAIF